MKLHLVRCLTQTIHSHTYLHMRIVPLHWIPVHNHTGMKLLCLYKLVNIRPYAPHIRPHLEYNVILLQIIQINNYSTKNTIQRRKYKLYDKKYTRQRMQCKVHDVWYILHDIQGKVYKTKHTMLSMQYKIYKTNYTTQYNIYYYTNITIQRIWCKIV